MSFILPGGIGVLRPGTPSAILSSLLMHFDNDFSDATGNHTAILQNYVAIDHVFYKFGGGALLPQSAALNSNLTITDNLGRLTFAGDFTVDFWWNYPIGGTSWGGATLFDIGNSTLRIVQAWSWSPEAGNVQALGANVGGASLLDTAALTPGWLHVALTRRGSAVYLFKNGTLVASGIGSGTLTPTGGVYIGSADGAWPLQGNIDEVRVVNGRAAWTANFTPPTEAYTE